MSTAEQLKSAPIDEMPDSAKIEASKAQYWRGLALSEEEVRAFGVASDELNARTQTYETSSGWLHERFRKVVEESWAKLRNAREQHQRLVELMREGIHTEIDGVPSVDYEPYPIPDSYRDAAMHFEQEFESLLHLRDDPDTLFVTARIIDVDTSAYGMSDYDNDMLRSGDYGEDEQGAIIRNAVVRAEMIKNDDWGNGWHQSFDEAEEKTMELRRQDEIAMSRIQSRIDLEDDATAYMLKYNGLYHSVVDIFGCDITDLSEPAKLQLLGYLATVKNKDVGRIGKAAGRLSAEARPLFAEAFLATEFGDDFGDRLLTIAEHAKPEEAARVFELLNTYRDYSDRFASFFARFDGELAVSAEKAMNERITDLVATVEKVARDGAFTEDVAPHRDSPDYRHDGRFDITISSVAQAIETMEHLEASLGLITTIASSPDAHVSRVVENEVGVGYQIYRFSDPAKGDMLLHIRPEAAGVYDKGFEYGNYNGVEATVSFVVNPVAPHRLRSDKDPRGVSIRFDREGRAPGEAPDSKERSPVRDDGMISLDISSGLGKEEAVPVQIGRSIAAGNRLRATEQGQETSLHHNTNYFDHQTYGSAAGFKRFAEYVKAMAEARIATQRAGRLSHRALVGASLPE